MTRKRTIRQSRRHSPQSKLGGWWMLIAVVAGLGGLGVWLFAKQATPEPETAQSARATFPHIHGLGWTSDGTELRVAAHDGIRVFSQNRWTVPEAPSHDFMGYTATDSGFYSSGHPDPRVSALVNPLGLVASTDGGQTITTLGFAGEYDFHTMGVGYYSHAIYLFAPSPSPILAQGINYSLDNGATWHPSPFPGLAGEPYQITVHPTDPAVVAVATANGVFISTDHGATTTPLDLQEPVAAATFHPDGVSLLLGGTQLVQYDYVNDKSVVLPTPLSGNDIIAAIAVNPTQPAKIAIASHARAIYQSSDAGQTWQPLALNGVGIDQP